MEQNADARVTMSPVVENKQNGGNGLKIATAIACVAAVCGIGFGIYGMIQSSQKDSQISDLQTQSKIDDEKETTLSNCENTEGGAEVIDLINNGKRVGTYSIYMGENSMGEYTLTLFSTDDQNNGFFSLIEATPMSYNQVASGYYSIKDSNIEFYQNLQDDYAKNSFVNAFSMQLSDLYQDDQALSEGYNIQYRLKLNYRDGEISNSKMTLEKLY